MKHEKAPNAWQGDRGATKAVTKIITNPNTKNNAPDHLI